MVGIKSVLDYAKARGWRDGENPARWRGHVANMLPNRTKVRPVEHHAALPWREIGGFMSGLENSGWPGRPGAAIHDPDGGAAGEAIEDGAMVGNRHDDERVDRAKASRMKAAREHRVPLSDAALAVLRAELPTFTSRRCAGRMGVSGRNRPGSSVVKTWCS